MESISIPVFSITIIMHIHTYIHTLLKYDIVLLLAFIRILSLNGNATKSASDPPAATHIHTYTHRERELLNEFIL